MVECSKISNNYLIADIDLVLHPYDAALQDRSTLLNTANEYTILETL